MANIQDTNQSWCGTWQLNKDGEQEDPKQTLKAFNLLRRFWGSARRSFWDMRMKSVNQAKLDCALAGHETVLVHTVKRLKSALIF